MQRQMARRRPLPAPLATKPLSGLAARNEDTMVDQDPEVSKTLTFNWDESDETAHQGRFEVTERETQIKTITTTTTIKRSFPPISSRLSRPVEMLDKRTYPLAGALTPPHLSSIVVNLSRLGIAADELLEDTKATVAGVEPGDQHSDVANEPNPVTSIKSPRPVRPSPLNKAQPFRRSLRARTRASSPSITTGNSRTSQGQPRSLSAALFQPATGSPRRPTIRGLQEGNSVAANYLATPDTSEYFLNAPDLFTKPKQEQPDASPDATSLWDASSPSGPLPAADFRASLSAMAAATPPVTDADADLCVDKDDYLADSINVSQPVPSSDLLATQDRSLISPRQSPTLTVPPLSALCGEESVNEAAEGEDEEATERTAISQRSQWQVGSQVSDDATQSTSLVARSSGSPSCQATPTERDFVHFESIMSMVDAFDSIPEQLKPFLLFQMLRKSQRSTLRQVAEIVNPALRFDLFKELPIELKHHILQFFDHKDLCRAAQVSKHWRGVVDGFEAGWKDLLDRDGYQVPNGELERAIREGWGWQDPVGFEGGELDLSPIKLKTEKTGATGPTREPRPLRHLKRKRLAHSADSERAKRRTVSAPASTNQTLVRRDEAEGPMSLANAAAMAVPDPGLGLPSLRKLHLFKSIYRRHHMIRASWTNKDGATPSHIAFPAHSGNVITCLKFDGDRTVTGSDDTFIHIYDTKSGRLLRKLAGHDGGVWALDYQGNTLVSGSTDRSVRVWDMHKGRCTQVFYGHTSTVRCLQILMPSPEGSLSYPVIITGSRDSMIRMWRLPSPTDENYFQQGMVDEKPCPFFIRQLSGHAGSVRAIAASGDTLVSGSYDCTVRVWKVSTGECVHRIEAHQQKVYSVVIDRKRNRCISGSMDATVKIWDLDTGALVHILEGHSLLVGLLDLQADRLVSAAADSTLRIWEPETGICRSALAAHTGAITCFQHDDHKVISGSDKTIKMWDVRTGKHIKDLLTDLGGVWQLRFDHRRLVAAVQRNEGSYIEVIDFGAARDGVPKFSRGMRNLLEDSEASLVTDVTANAA